MTVSSKFDYGQRIFWLENNKVESAVVKSIDFGRFYKINGVEYHSQIMYFVSKNKKSRTIDWNGGGLKEKQCFASKKELIQSL